MADVGPDHLFNLRNSFYLGAYQVAINNSDIPNLSPDDAVERDSLVYFSHIALGSYQLVISEIDDSAATPLQAVKLLALYLSSPDAKESTIASLKEWLADSAIGNNAILRLVAGIIFTHEGDYNEALKHTKSGGTMDLHALNVQIFIKMHRTDFAERHLRIMQQIDEDHTLTQLATAWLNLAVQRNIQKTHRPTRDLAPPDVKQWRKNLENMELYQFTGKDNVPFHTPQSLLKPPEDRSVAAAQKSCLSSAEQLDAIFQKIDENREGRISKEELIAVRHEFHINGDSHLPELQLQASTVVPLPDVICCDTGVTEKQNAESNVEMMVAKVGDGGSSAKDGGDSFDGAGVKDNRDGAAIVDDSGDANRSVLMIASTVVPLPDLISCDTGVTEKQNARTNVEMMVAKVGNGGSSGEDGGDSFDGAGVSDNGDGAAIVGGGRDVNLSVIWLLLIHGMNLVKAGSLALCLLTFFFDKQLSFYSKDTLYLRIAFVCGVSAFFVAPWHVLDANATLRDQDMQEIAVLTLLLGVLTLMVIALDEQFRVPVLICCLVVIRAGRGLEEA